MARIVGSARTKLAAAQKRQSAEVAWAALTANTTDARLSRVAERRRAVALARHYRDYEALSIRQIADRLGRSPATVKANFYDPTGEKARAVKARYVGVCRGCGAYTQPRNGKGDAYASCKRCHPGAIARRWTRELVIEAMCEWRERYGRLPSSYDLSRARARERRGGGQAAGFGDVAGGERREPLVRYVGSGSLGGSRPRVGAADPPGVVIGQQGGLAA
jgi:hypothetical protein